MRSDVCAVVPISPVPSHPDTAILETTIESIRYHLPDAPIVLTFDGVRPELEHRRSSYEHATYRTLWRADHQWGNTIPFVWDKHLHQIGMLRAVIDTIDTPLVLWCEQDTPLVIDEPIDWDACITMITTGEADIIRYAHEALILPDHQHMMIGQPENQFQRTCQYSARPHLASTAYYRRILPAHFSVDANCFIEDVMHSVCHEAWRKDKMAGFYQHRIWIYHPDGGNIKRSWHLDARAGDPKLDETQVF